MKRYAYAPIVLLVFLTATGCRTILVARGFPTHEGELSGLPLRAPVEVLRDRWGIPHIYARNEEDLLVALGYIHAQDRLWQMETYRLITEGRLSEIAGEETLMLDYFMRLLDLPGFKRRMVQSLSPETRLLLEEYVSGINAYIEAKRDDLPLEFRTLELEPRPWKVVDCMTVPALIAWYMQANYNEELLALLRGGEIERRDWNLLFASHPDAEFPEDSYFEELGRLLIAPLHPAVLALFELVPELYRRDWRELLAGLSRQTGASNNWAVAKGADGFPLLANDPHLGITVPGFWYLCHLDVDSPEAPLRVVGATIPGLPAVPVGRNEHVAWGVTNVMMDNVDLFIVKIDPDRPTRYIVSGQEREMSREELTFGLSDGRTIELPLYRTVYGPVITQVVPGVDAVASLKWYGTLPERELEDRTAGSMLALARAESAEEIVSDLRGVKILALNFLAADVGGNIAWHATGAAPIRSCYSGRLPADGSSGTMDWRGFLPYDRLPSLRDPAHGWWATANHCISAGQGPGGASPEGSPSGGGSAGSGTTDHRAAEHLPADEENADPRPTALSYSWAAPYRYERIAEVLRAQVRPSVADFGRLQLDDYCKLAERLLPRLAAYTYRDKRALRAMDMLEKWDRRLSADSAAAAVFEVFVSEWLNLALADDLGQDLLLYFNGSTAGYTAEDVLLEHPGSALWDRADTPEWETPEKILEEALVRAIEYLEAELGRNPDRWSWGRLHRYYFRHSGATSRFEAWLLNRGPYPAPGDGNTVNPGYYAGFPGYYDVFWISSLRMIAPLGDIDGTLVVAPMGQSGQPGHPHYDDMIVPWLEGQYASLPLSRGAVEVIAVQRLVLRP